MRLFLIMKQAKIKDKTRQAKNKPPNVGVERQEIISFLAFSSL